MAQINDITAQDVQARLSAGEITLVDVREANEFGAERIHGALLMPLSTLEPKAMPHTADRPVVLQCGSGKRSAMALERCQAAGVDITEHMQGGIGAWKSAGLPTVQIDPATGKVIDPVS